MQDGGGRAAKPVGSGIGGRDHRRVTGKDNQPIARGGKAIRAVQGNSPFLWTDDTPDIRVRHVLFGGIVLFL
ncbi:hypothetical protein GCM10011504_30810 [Siccirubricoccus deserti]|nr:hypothetical protein GCM10011504_30810 [Siccirubricoccus deserti]